MNIHIKLLIKQTVNPQGGHTICMCNRCYFIVNVLDRLPHPLILGTIMSELKSFKIAQKTAFEAKGRQFKYR